MEKYYLLMLKYLSEQREPSNLHNVQIEGIPANLIRSMVDELFEKELINTGIGGYFWINQAGSAYLTKHELGIKEETPLVHIGHNITGQNTFNQSFNENLSDSPINSPTNTPKQKTTKYPAIKWIMGIIAMVIAGLIVWYLTKP